MRVCVENLLIDRIIMRVKLIRMKEKTDACPARALSLCLSLPSIVDCLPLKLIQI